MKPQHVAEYVALDVENQRMGAALTFIYRQHPHIKAEVLEYISDYPFTGDMSLHDLSPEDGDAWAEAALAEPDFTVVKAYFNSAGVVKHSVFVKVNGRWLMPGNEAYWCDTDGDLREQFDRYEVVARPALIDGDDDAR